MQNVIQLNSNRKIKKETKMSFTKLQKSLGAKGNKKNIYTPKRASEIADKILEASKDLGYENIGETPIESIIKAFGLKVFGVSKINGNSSGVIYVGGTTNQCYGNDKVIFTDKNEPFEHQRFVAAHELGHYLFDCLGDPQYQNPNILFSETYPKCDHDSEKEIIADRFAAELLMPHELFKKQYISARDDKKYNPTGSQAFIIDYLSKYFKVKETSVIKRIGEVFYDGGF